MVGKWQRGRRRPNFIGGLASAVGCGAVDMLCLPADQAGFKEMVASDMVPKEGEH